MPIVSDGRLSRESITEAPSTGLWVVGTGNRAKILFFSGRRADGWGGRGQSPLFTAKNDIKFADKIKGMPVRALFSSEIFLDFPSDTEVVSC